MTEFSAEEHDNTLNPYSLTPKEAEKIYKSIDDERFLNPSGEYFLLKLADKEIEIPKQKKIGVKQDDGSIKVVSVIEYAHSLLSNTQDA